MSYKKTDKIVYQGKKVRVHECEMDFPSGEKPTYEYVSFDALTGVSILPVTEAGVKLIRHYKLGLDREMWSLPTGGLEAGEDPEERAQAELREETGFAAKKLKLILRFHPIPGYVGGDTGYIYLATGLYPSTKPGDEPFPIEVDDFTFEEILKLIKNQQISDGKTIAAVLYFQQFLRA